MLGGQIAHRDAAQAAERLNKADCALRMDQGSPTSIIALSESLSGCQGIGPNRSNGTSLRDPILETCQHLSISSET